MNKERRSYSLEDKLLAVKMHKLGYSYLKVSRELGFSETRIKYWVNQYRTNGAKGLKRPVFQHYVLSFKMKVVEDIEKNMLSYDLAALKYNVSPSAARCWAKIVQRGGYDALKVQKKSGRPHTDMKKSKSKLTQSPIEKLENEILFLKAENAYLKKLRALVKERIARESGK